MKRLGYKKNQMGNWQIDMTPRASMWMDLVFPRWEHNMSKDIKNPKAWRLAGAWAKKKVDEQFKSKKEKTNETCNYFSIALL